MKTIMFILIAATVLHSGMNIFAQSSISLGVRGGLNFANITGKDLPPEVEKSYRTVFGIGGVGEIGLSDLIFLQVEPRYIQKGANFKASETISDITITHSSTGKFNYFEIPVSLKYKIDVGVFKPYLFTGPTVSFLLSAELEEINFEGRKKNEDIKDETKLIEFSMDIGAGVAYEISPTISLTGDIRYTLGLTNNAKSSNPADDRNWKSRDVKLFVGLLFSL